MQHRFAAAAVSAARHRPSLPACLLRPTLPLQAMMADIRRNQGRLQEAHERSKTVTRTDEMKKLREQMQASLRLQRRLPVACGGRSMRGSKGVYGVKKLREQMQAGAAVLRW